MSFERISFLTDYVYVILFKNIILLGGKVSMSDKKKVLFSFVGSRDPYSDKKFKRIWRKIKGQGTFSEGSVLTACRELKPDVVYLFPSSKEKAAETANPENHTEDKANEAQKIITSQLGIKNCNVMSLMTDNATDFTKLYTCLRNNMREIFNNLTKNHPDEQNCIQENYELIFILTSGTQQMNEAARLFLQSLPYEFKCYRCIDPIHAQGNGRVKPLSLGLADETWLLKSIEANVDGYYFHSVVENCERLNQVSVLKPRQFVADGIKEFFSAYESMDLMQYGIAYEKISSTANKLRKTKESFTEKLPVLSFENISDVLNRQIEFLESLKEKVKVKDESESVNNLIDLYYNMKRAYTRGNYVDVLSRFWRLREGMMNYRMWTLYHIDRRNIKRQFADNDEPEREAKLRALCDSKQHSQKVEWATDRVRNDLGAMSSLLINFFNDGALGEFERTFGKELEHVRTIRNQTIVGHGMLPVSKDDADTCIKIGEEIIKLIPGGAEVWANYPFKLENMREVLNLLKTI